MKKFVSGLIVGAIVTTTISTFAGGVWDKIDVLKNDINVMVDGKQIFADNFVYNDTTYLPLRAVSEALNQPVEYDKATNTAYIGEKPVGSVNNSGVSNGKLPDPLWIEKDGIRYTNDEFQIHTYLSGETDDYGEFINPSPYIEIYDIVIKANEIVGEERYSTFDDNITEKVPGTYKSRLILSYKDIVYNGNNIPLEYYYSIYLPWLRSLK